MTKTSRTFRVRAGGEIACFTRPELKVERVSYEVMTPSAARGILEAVLWKPAISWRVHTIEVLAPIRWISFRRNEVKAKASGVGREIYADESARRLQRNTVALRDVDYVIHATFAMTDCAGREDNVAKFESMFDRRLSKGQYFHAPYLGCREFVAAIEAAGDDTQPIDSGVERPLGMMFYDFDYGDDGAVRPMFFDARLVGGRVSVPDRQTVATARASI